MSTLTRLVPPELVGTITTVLHGHPAAAVGILLGYSLVKATFRLLAEWQRRLTFDHILTKAPGGTVIIQEKSKAGPAMWIMVGTGNDPTPDRPERFNIVVRPFVGLPGPWAGSDDH